MKYFSLTMGLVTVLLVICMFGLGSCSRTLQQIDNSVFDVLQFGAVGDGAQDDSNAFLAAWTAACGAECATTVIIPSEKTFLLSPLGLQGPCKSPTINVQVMGTLVALDIKSWPAQNSIRWILFSNVNGLIVNGNGVFDGKGADWWSKYAGDPHSRPTTLAFETCDNLQIRSLTFLDSPRNHLSIQDCNGVTISNLQITAPADSPNTDGIDVSRSTGVTIYECIIATGDDCIAINGQTANINITNIGCGPGHGISIGSLGENGATDTVEEVHVSHSSFYKTANGVRIKTWQGGKGYARSIFFEDITLIETDNPIIIDQFYCDKHSSAPCKDQATDAVQISDVTFDGFHGTSTATNAIQLDCSDTYGCSGIVLSNINITSIDPAQAVSSTCVNAHGQSMGIIEPIVDCLLP